MKAVLWAGLVLLSMISEAAAQPEVAETVPVALRRIPAQGVQPEVAVGADGAVHMVFLTGDPRKSDVMHARRAPSEREFAAPALVGEPGSAVAIGAVCGAQIAVDPEGRVHIVWNGSGKRSASGAGAHESSPLLYARSEDGGIAFSAPCDLMGTSWALDGGASVAAATDGRVTVAWHAAYREGHGDSARGLFVNRSDDGGRTFAGEARVEQAGTGCCECCALKAVTDSKGRMNILYRAAAGSVDRDMRLLTASDGQETYWAVPVDPWKVDSCPVTTCDAVSAGDRLVIAWETQGQVWVGVSDQASGTLVMRSPAPGPGGSRKHPAVAADGRGRVLLAWAEVEGFGKAGTVGWQVFEVDPKAAHGAGGRLKPINGAAGTADGLPAWSFPAAVAEADGFTILY